MKISALLGLPDSNEKNIEHIISVVKQVISKTWNNNNFCLVNNNQKTRCITFQLIAAGRPRGHVDISKMYSGDDPTVSKKIHDKLFANSIESRMRFKPTVDNIINTVDGILGYYLVSDFHKVDQTVSLLRPIEEFDNEIIPISVQEIRLVFNASAFKLK